VTIVRSLALLVLVAALGGGALALAYGTRDGLLVAALFLITGTPVLGLSHLLVRRRDRVGSLSRQFQVVIGVAVGLVLLAVGVVAALMFFSAHDAFVLALLLAFAGALAAYSATLVARTVMEDIESVRDGVIAVGEGDRDLRIETGADDELAELASSANRMIEQLSEAESRCGASQDARRQLIAAVSHDLRTPLSSLQLLSDAISDGLVDSETRRSYLQQMSVQVRSLSSLVEDLFELSRLEAGDIDWSLQQVQMGDLVEETVEAMRAQADSRGVWVSSDIPDDLVLARANPEKLQRVLFNLIQNAIRHTPADGSVTVRAESNEHHVEVEVADTGGGIDEHEQERVFEPFFRGEQNGSRSRKGAGLGLTICRAIVEAHGGRIWLAPSTEGACVRFSLPRATGAS